MATRKTNLKAVDDSPDLGLTEADLERDEGTKDFERERITNFSLDDIESMAEEGVWREFELDIAQGAKTATLFFEMLILPYESKEVQAFSAELREQALKQFPQLRNEREAALKRGDRWEFPSKVAAKINRRIVEAKVVKDWRGIDAKFTLKNVQRLLDRVPFLVDDILSVSGQESNYLSVRSEEAVENLAPTSGDG